MSEESDQQDKTEEATPRRLEKAREDGQIPRSKELTTVLMLLAGFALLWLIAGPMLSFSVEMMESTFSFERDRAVDPKKAMIFMGDTLASSGASFSSFFIIMLVLSLLVPALLGGWVFTAKSFAPKLSKMNPIAGLKKMFSMQTVIELLKAICKSVLVGTVAVVFIKAVVPEFMALSRMAMHQALGDAFHQIFIGVLLISASLIVVVMIDVPYQLTSHAKKLRMTKEEVKREHKESEGDPHLKAKIRSQQQAMARSRMMSKVPKADVIITNPTHFSVALSYDESGTGAPRVVAKGTDAVALRIREIGDENGVAILEAPPLARALYWHVDLDREIPENLYVAVAEVMAWVYGLKAAENYMAPAPKRPKDISVPKGMDSKPKK